MRHGSHSSRAPLVLLLLLVMILLSVQNTAVASRFLRPLKPDHVKMKDAGGVEEEEPWNLMGMEACAGGTEECLERRMMSEAHLDYIYTQRHPQP
ncbi:putative phytosulfokines 6 [Musa acuminata AAA Group]|nr:PREDICTED: putative phytosulfokines 6 [Musa acuminata subsp. malaccensis]